MRWAIRILLAIAVVWSLYWLGASYLSRTGIMTWFAARANEGWQADYAEIASSGFPLRFQTELINPALADPDTGTAWQADRLSFDSPAIWPGTLRVGFADTPQRLSYFDQTIALTAADMGADLHLAPGAALELGRLALTAGPWGVTSDAATLLSAQSLILAMDQTDATETYDFEISVMDFTPGERMRRLLRTADTLPTSFETLTLQMAVTFDRTWDRRALEAKRPQPQHIDLRVAEARWGELRILAAGDLRVDAQGVPTGAITVKADNWQTMLDMAETSGALPPQLRGTVEQGLLLLSGLSGNPNALDVQFNFADGFVSLGPFPIGPAPRFILR